MYKQLLKLYPRHYRKEYSEQMLVTLDDMVSDEKTLLGRAIVKMRAYAELPLSIGQQNLATAGHSFVHDTPKYGRQASVIGLILLLPSFLIIASDITDNTALIDSRAWIIFLTIGLVILPAGSFAINAIAYMRWILSDGVKRRDLADRLLDIKRTWAMLVVGGLGLLWFAAILLHDSTYCITGNPSNALQHMVQAWQCVSHGALGGE